MNATQLAHQFHEIKTQENLTVLRRSPLNYRCGGFSLLEVLISIIILSFGLLGMVGMQAAAMQANKEARMQSTAVRMARELGEMMRGNKNVGVQTTTADNPYLITFKTADTVTAAATNCFTANCSSGTATALATFEVQDWLTRINTELPGARVKVCFDSTPYDSSGTPKWVCDDTGGVAVIKIGWTRSSTNRAATGAAAFEKAVVSSTEVAAPPSVVLTVSAGSTT